MGTAVPLDRLGVSFEEFATMLDEAVRRYHAAQDDRYLAAVLATPSWIAGMVDNDPLTRQLRPATLSAQQQVRVATTAITYNVEDPIFGLTDTIHPDWARGIARTLEWILGPDHATGRRQQPLP
ncbi:MAG: hypothetical protein GEV12_00650 [Micromonosporaceae bacterium]|nr:hypothetical protein [Micromonosporaceae bacterium]